MGQSWVSVRYAHQGQEPPTGQPDNSWDPGAFFSGLPSGWGLSSGWWGYGTLGANLIENPFAIPLETGGYTSPDAQGYDYSGVDMGPAYWNDQTWTRDIVYPTSSGWHMFFPTYPSGTWGLVDHVDDWAYETVREDGAPVASSLYFELSSSNISPIEWHERWWDSNNELYLRLHPVPHANTDTIMDPPWPQVNPGQTYAARVSIACYPGYLDTDPRLGNAVGVEWYRAPNMIDEWEVVKIGESVGERKNFAPAGSEPDSPRWFYPGTYGEMTENMNSRSPVGTFVAPPGADYAKPFVQLWVDGWTYYFTNFFFGEVL